ncbi:MAG: hypothetical protein KDH15_01330 [Rhodocyclaceae bacterium]|nr:hypothetical protein [Rhodocyclaceae bacterium]
MAGKGPPGDEFSMLVEDLHEWEARQQRAREAQPDEAADGPLRLVWTIAAWCAAATSLWLAVPQAGPGPAQIRKDLLHLLEQSRSAVERSRLRTGELPTRIPSPALASLVSYHPLGGGGGYELEARLGAQIIIWRSRQPDRFEERRL